MVDCSSPIRSSSAATTGVVSSRPGVEIDEDFQPSGVGTPPRQIQPPALELLLHRIGRNAETVRQGADRDPFFRHCETMTERSGSGKLGR